VQAENGNVVLVLTILESKGMEFDDVLLLDFFTSSPCPSGLRNLKDIHTTGCFEDGGARSAVGHTVTIIPQVTC
jgi:ATP-dependent exoDNAse (exonuclease V) beta subunit